MENEIEKLEAFNRVSKIVDFILEELELPQFKALVINHLWENKNLCLSIDKKVREIYG